MLTLTRFLLGVIAINITFILRTSLAQTSPISDIPDLTDFQHIIGLVHADYGNGKFVEGSGTLLGNRGVLTCAHVLCGPHGQKISSVTFGITDIKGKKRSATTRKHIYIFSNYRDDLKALAPSYNEGYLFDKDIGCIKLPKSLGAAPPYLFGVDKKILIVSLFNPLLHSGSGWWKGLGGYPRVTFDGNLKIFNSTFPFLTYPHGDSTYTVARGSNDFTAQGGMSGGCVIAYSDVITIGETPGEGEFLAICGVVVGGATGIFGTFSGDNFMGTNGVDYSLHDPNVTKLRKDEIFYDPQVSYFRPLDTDVFTFLQTAIDPNIQDDPSDDFPR